MTPKPLLLICAALLSLTYTSRAQLLKKVKDKVNKTISGGDKNSDKKEDNNASSDNNGGKAESASSGDDSKSSKWCEGLDAGGGSGSSGSATKDGVDYKKVYSSDNGFTILYDESSMGNNSKDFRLVLSEKVNNKYQYVFIENGSVVAKDSKVHPEWFANSSQARIRDKKGEVDEAMKKYIVGDTMKYDVAKSDAKTATVQKIDEDRYEMALQIARQTDDYKKMSDAEKKEFEENTKKALAANNSMAGTTYDIPAQQGGTAAVVNGYYVVVKGKKYGKFMMVPVVQVSNDETKFLAVGTNEQAAPVLVVNGKTTPLDKNKFNGMQGRIVKSPDGKKYVYVEMRKMSEQEIQNMSNAAGNNQRQVFQYNVIRADGNISMITDYSYNGNFRLTNSGQLVFINEETGEVYADGKSIGKFSLKPGDRLDNNAVLIGNDISQIAYYDGAEGTFTYLNGTVKNLGMTAPHFSSENGKGYVSWFRKCGKDIYIARYAY